MSTASKEDLVPYVAIWSEEMGAPSFPVFTRRGISYLDEHPLDRDNEGALWYRAVQKPRQGRPALGGVHTLRQRRVMRRFLCQVCANDADRSEQGILWVLGTADKGD